MSAKIMPTSGSGSTETPVGRANVYTIPPGIAFVDALAAALLAEHGDPLALSQVTILLPTRRAVRSLGDAFLRRGDGNAMLLPVMRPIGDLEEDDLDLVRHAIDDFGQAVDLPPPVSEVERQVLLAHLVRRWFRRTGIGASGPTQAIRLAADLARLIDQVQTARLSFNRLERLVEGELAQHWQATVRFLSVVKDHWPQILEARGKIDPADRRNRLLARLAESWQRHPPAGPVIAAGSTGSIPATADLLAVIADLPRGRVVLPGLDRDMDESSWRVLDEAHPQFGLRQLLDRLGVERAHIRDWPGTSSRIRANRVRLGSELMRPEATADAWRDLAHIKEQSIEGLTAIACADPNVEAGVVALLMRKTLESPEKTAALITADRNLARLVRAQLHRWNIEIDDSAGQRLSTTVPGVFLRLCLQVLVENAAPVPLLALIKHPLAAGGDAAARFRANARALELACLRGPRPGSGFDGLKRALATAERTPAGLVAWIDSIAKMAAPLSRALRHRKISLSALAEAHVGFAEALAATDEDTGAARLWASDAGETCAALFAEFAEAVRGLAPAPGIEYPALIESLLERTVVRPRYGMHPRLAIWGPLEARLQQADLMILGGLNEGSWPRETEGGPWLSRPMRTMFGLPSPARMVGLAAHDFVQAFAAPEVVLTRSQKVDGTPTVPSRWLTRLHAVLRGAGLDGRTDGDRRWIDWQAALDTTKTAARPTSPPEPRPPLHARPRALPVTQIERWMRDPYEIYARHILNLSALETIDAKVNHADYGKYVHHTLDIFVRELDGPIPDDALERLLSIGRKTLSAMPASPTVQTFWWPRFVRVARWFVARERQHREPDLRSFTEVRGELAIELTGGPFKVTAVADRIDIGRDGKLTIIDYKTGAIPSDTEVVAGFAPQLPLEAVIARAGGFEGIEPSAIGALAFWRLRGGDPAGEQHELGPSADRLADQALGGVTRLITEYDDPRTPYPARPAPAMAPRYGNYDHLARTAEWSTLEDIAG